MINLKLLGKVPLNFIKRNDTYILTGMTVAGVVCTAVLSGKAAVKAYKVIEEEEYSKGLPLSNKEKFQKTWKIFIPPFASAVATATLSIGAQALNKRTEAVLLKSYLAEAAMRKTFEEKTKEVVGEKKVEKIRNDIDKDRVQTNPPDEKNIIPTKHGHSLFMDAWTHQYFYTDAAFLKTEAAKFINAIRKDQYKSLNDFYYMIDLPEAECGNKVGWHNNMDDINNVDEFIWFGSTITPYGEPCGVLHFEVEPLFDFDRMY